MREEQATTSAKRRVPIFALFGATALSWVGNYLSFVALPWFVLQTTGSAAKTGLTGGVIALAAILAGVFGGPAVDRLGFKRTSVISDLASGVPLALIPLLYHTVGLAFWQLLALVFAGSFLDAPGQTARNGLIPVLSRMAAMPTERANSAHQAIQRGAFLLGPPLAGILIAALGASGVLLLDAATFAFSAVVIAVGVPSPARMGGRISEHPVAEPSGGAGYFAELAEGLVFIWRDRLILSIAVVAAVASLLIEPFLSVVLPVYAKATYGSAVELGLVLAGFGGGSLVGAVLYGVFGARLPRRATFVAANFAIATTFWVMSLTPSLYATVGTAAVMGLAVGPLNPLLFTVEQERTPEAMLGRVLGPVVSIALVAVPLGMVLAGYLLEAVGVRFTLIAIAAIYSAMSLGLLVNPAFREMDATKQRPTS